MPTITTLEAHEYTAPSHWATYFFNDDSSGMDDDDIAAADAFIDWVGMGAPVDCTDDVGFTHYHDAHRFCPLGADCYTYTFLDYAGTKELAHY